MSAEIASVETILVGYPTTGQFKFLQPQAGSTATRNTVVVRITDGSGAVGWGQSVPSPTWSYETHQSVRTTIDEYLGPAIVRLDPFDQESIASRMHRCIAGSFSTGQPICKAGIDLALHDLRGKIRGTSLAKEWSGSTRERITLSWTVDVQEVDDVEQTFERAVALGFRHFNVKVGSNANLDLAVCHRLRQLAPQSFIWVDANGGYDLDTACALAPQFADLQLAALEQPFPANRLSWYAKLRRQRALPILMDEGIVSLIDLMEFHQLGLLDGVAMKVARCGGLSEAHKIATYLREHGLLFFASGLTDPDISLAASLILLASFDFDQPAALNAPQFLSGSILKKPIEIRGDQATVPTEIGLGVDVDEDSMRRLMDEGPAG